MLCSKDRALMENRSALMVGAVGRRQQGGTPSR